MNNNNPINLPFSKFTQGFLNTTDENFYIIGVGYDCNPMQNKPETLNIRQYYTLHWILNGKLHLTINKKKYILSSNTILLIPPKTPFRYYPDNEEPCGYIFFEFNGNLASSYVNIVSQKKPFLQFSPPNHLFVFFENYFLRAHKNRSISYYDTLSIFYSLLSSYLTPIDTTSTSSDIISSIKLYIKTHILDPDFSLENVVTFTNFSHSHLCKLFKKHTNITLISYIQQQKLKSAKNLLATTNIPVSHIAEVLGFASESYFFSIFKKTYHITPLKYRKNQNPHD